MSTMGPEGFAQRAQAILQSVPGLDHQTIAGVAQTSANPQQAVQQASSLADTLRNTWDGYEQAYFDPVLQQQPSKALALAQFLHNTVGVAPVQAGHISQVQASLQSAGVGKDLTADGAWTPQWQQAYNAELQAMRQDQMAGDKPGSSKTSSLLHSFLHDISPTGIADTAVGFMKSVRRVVADSEAATANIGNEVSTLTHGSLWDRFKAAYTLPSALMPGINTVQFNLTQHGNVSQQAAQAAATVESIGGKKETADEYAGTVGVANAIGDALTLASFVPLGRVVATTKAAIGEDLAKGILPKGAPELARKPGVIAKTLFGADGGRILGSRWVANQPALARLVPMVTGSNSDGWYYALRSKMAQRYRLPIVRAAGTAFGRAQAASTGVHIASQLAPGSEMQSDVDRTGIISAVDANLAQRGPRFFGWSPLDLNNLQLALHGPLTGAGRTSQVVGKAVNDFNKAFADNLGAKGVPAAFQMAFGAGGKALTREQLLKIVGGSETELNDFMSNKVEPYARDFYIERQLGSDVNLPDSQQQARVEQLSNQFYRLPNDQKNQVVADMLDSDNGAMSLALRIKADMLRNQSDPKTALANSYAEYANGKKLLQQAAQVGDLKYYLTPKAAAAVHDEQQAAQIAGRAPSLVSEDVQRITPNEPGMFGLARADSVTKAQAMAKAQQFEDAYNAAPTLEGQNTVWDAARQWAHDNLSGMDQRALDLYAPKPDKLWALIRQRADGLAADVHLTYDAPQAVKDRFHAIKDAGYKVVVGTHIGHVYDGTGLNLNQVGGWLTPIRRALGALGLDPERIRDTDVGRAIHTNLVSNLTHTLNNDPRLVDKIPPLVTAHTLIGLLVNDKAIDDLELPWYGKAELALAAKVGGNKSAIKLIQQEAAKTSNPLTLSEARGKLESDLAYQQSVRAIPQKKIIDTLTNPKTVITDSGGEWNYPGMDRQSATIIARAVQRSWKMPTYMMGLSELENLARSGFSILDKAATAHPDSNLLQKIANTPNRIVQLRNQLRFTMSPVFDSRRLMKQTLKAGLEGVYIPPDPLGDLMATGEVDKAAAMLNKLAGKTGGLDDSTIEADKYLVSHGISGLYNPQWHAAYFVLKHQQDGNTWDDTQAAYNRAFKYGANGGTSPLERTVNTIFFPFSFEKTVVRNSSAYLLDHPGQALLLSAGVEAWRQADKNGEIGQWVHDHLPVLYEMNQLNNAFVHGISPGQFGGLNAPIIGDTSHLLLNLFLPQNWNSGYTKKNLQKYLPVWQQLGKLVQSAAQQKNIVDNAAYDTINHVVDAHWNDRPTITPDAQLTAALKMKYNMQANPAIAQIIDYNNRQSSDADKYTWPSDTRLPNTIWGKPVDKTTIGEYVSFVYPAYNPQAAAAKAQSKAVQADKFIASIQDPQKQADMRAFKKVADQVISRINADKYSNETIAQVDEQFRTAAMNLASKDPEWLTFYNRYYASSLGPITDFTGKGVTGAAKSLS